MTDELERVYISVGSNIRPEENIIAAQELLQRRVKIVAVSTFFQTPAIDRPQQPDYLNGVWEIRTALEPRRLKGDVLRDIEQRLGRRRSADKYAARTIDLDILLYGRRVIDEPDLQAPDPDLRSRNFLGAALLELSPQLILPDGGEPLKDLPILQSTEGLHPRRDFTERLKERMME